MARSEGLTPFLAWSLLELAGVLGPRTDGGREALEEANGLRIRMGLARVRAGRIR